MKRLKLNLVLGEDFCTVQRDGKLVYQTDHNVNPKVVLEILAHEIGRYISKDQAEKAEKDAKKITGEVERAPLLKRLTQGRKK